MENTIKLPRAQKDIVVKALQQYQVNHRTSTYPTDDDQYVDFDLTTLIGIFKDSEIKIKIEYDNSTYNKFGTRHNVDFPKYV